MSAPATTKDYYCLQEAVREMKNRADRAASEAAKKKREEAEKQFMTELRRRYVGKTLFCYDEARDTNRFATQPLQEWNAVALSFEQCITLMQPHMIRCHGKDHWSQIGRQLQGVRPEARPALEPEQRLVFAAGGYWYCFFCIRGEDYCDKVEQYLACERKHDERHRSSEGIDVDFG